MRWRQIAEDVAVLSFPLRGFGIDFGRNVTLLRLRDGRLVIHSTADFSEDDVEAIRQFGEPAWLVDATVMHDTFAKSARGIFPRLPYLAPGGFSKASGVATGSLVPPPSEWSGEIEVLPIAGLRMPKEHVFYHRRSRTLVVADLLFHFSAETGGWPRFFARHFMRLPRLRGISAFFKLMIRDRGAFERSMEELLRWDFTQIVVGHGEPMQSSVRQVLEEALRARGFRIGHRN
ncbi:MAG: hypothetical protein ABI946_10210 [Chthoniobacterales bacterium]